MSKKIPPRLSKQQKFILTSLVDTGPHGKDITSLSISTAKEFNEGHNDRIWDLDKHMRNLKEGSLQKIRNLKKQTNDKGNLPPEVEEEGWKEVRNMKVLSRLVPALHKKKKLLTSKHRASFSRSLRELEERGLIRRLLGTKTKINEENIDTDDPVWEYTHLVGEGRTKKVWPTKRGRKAGKEIKKQARDGRYKLKFKTDF